MIAITVGDLISHVGGYFWDDDLGAHCYVYAAYPAAEPSHVVFDIRDLSVDGAQWVEGYADSDMSGKILCQGEWLTVDRVPRPFPADGSKEVVPRMVWRNGIAMAVVEALPGDLPFAL